MFLYSSLVITLCLFPEAILGALAPRIINGQDIDIRDYPFILNLNVGDNVITCGALLIAPEYILTAAHCFNQISPNSYKATYNCTDFAEAGCQSVEIVGVRKHPNYSYRYCGDTLCIQYDVAIARLARSIDNITPVKLPEAGLGTYWGEDGVLLGWGVTKPYELISKLQAINMKVDYCPRDIDTQFCVRAEEGSSCFGDSGGPFLIDNVLYGILSMGSDVSCSEGSVNYLTELSNRCIQSFIKTTAWLD